MQCFGIVSDQGKAASTELLLFAEDAGFAAAGLEDPVSRGAPDRAAPWTERTHLCSWKH